MPSFERTLTPTRLRAVALAIVVAGSAAPSIPTPATAQGTPGTMTTASGLQITDTKVGTGAAPRTGQICVMHYTGWLYSNGAKGAKFDSSLDRGQPFEFPIGTGQGHPRLGRGCRQHESGRQTHAHYSRPISATALAAPAASSHRMRR